jgi:hypothetical protein
MRCRFLLAGRISFAFLALKRHVLLLEVSGSAKNEACKAASVRPWSGINAGDFSAESFESKRRSFMESLLPLLVQLGSGALGGNIAGKLMPQASLGTIGNSLAGIAGGGIGGQLLGMVLGGATGGGMDIAGIISSIASGGVGGGVLMAVIGIVKGMMNK